MSRYIMKAGQRVALSGETLTAFEAQESLDDATKASLDADESTQSTRREALFTPLDIDSATNRQIARKVNGLLRIAKGLKLEA